LSFDPRSQSTYVLLTISIILGKRGFTLTEDEANWLPSFMPEM
jgi:hypothetical protein